MFEGSSYLAFIFYEKEKRDKQGLDPEIGHIFRCCFDRRKKSSRAIILTSILISLP